MGKDKNCMNSSFWLIWNSLTRRSLATTPHGAPSVWGALLSVTLPYLRFSLRAVARSKGDLGRQAYGRKLPNWRCSKWANLLLRLGSAPCKSVLHGVWRWSWPATSGPSVNCIKILRSPVQLGLQQPCYLKYRNVSRGNVSGRRNSSGRIRNFQPSPEYPKCWQQERRLYSFWRIIPIIKLSCSESFKWQKQSFSHWHVIKLCTDA